jgi:hypothetical protein
VTRSLEGLGRIYVPWRRPAARAARRLDKRIEGSRKTTDDSPHDDDGAPRTKIVPNVFCLVEPRVELRGLEPLTPCLQNTPRLSDAVAHLTNRHEWIHWDRPPRILLWSGLVVSIRPVQQCSRRPLTLQ